MLPEGKAVVGVTSLFKKIYVLRCKPSDHLEVYDAGSYRLRRSMTVPELYGFIDMTSCEHFHCIYIADHYVQCVFRLNIRGATTRWAVHDKPQGLAVNATHNVLVTCWEARKIKVFDTHGDLLREIRLPDGVLNPRHAIELTDGEFIVCHGDGFDAFHRVCKVSADGRDVFQSHGGPPGSLSDQYNGPARLANDNDEFLFVADLNNQRVTMLSLKTFEHKRDAVSNAELQGYPQRLHLDVKRRRLYVADNDRENSGEFTAGRVLVLRV